MDKQPSNTRWTDIETELPPEMKRQAVAHRKRYYQGSFYTYEGDIRNCLTKHLKKIEKKGSWIAPFGIAIALLSTWVTAEFKKALFLSAETWQAIFIIAGVITVCWLLKCVVEAIKSKSKEEIIKEIVDELKNM